MLVGRGAGGALGLAAAPTVAVGAGAGGAMVDLAGTPAGAVVGSAGTVDGAIVGFAAGPLVAVALVAGPLVGPTVGLPAGADVGCTVGAASVREGGVGWAIAPGVAVAGSSPNDGSRPMNTSALPPRSASASAATAISSTGAP